MQERARSRITHRVKEGRHVMRFLCLYKSTRPETNQPPAPQQMEAMGKLMQEMSQAGVLLSTEGCETSAKGARIELNSGKFMVSDGPFTDEHGIVGGYAVLKVKSKAEAIEWSKRFLQVLGEGASEIRQLREMSQRGE
jgi:hypothetical protein